MPTTGPAMIYPVQAPPQNDTQTPHTLREAAQEFESIFLAKLFESMRETVPNGGILGSDSGTKTFQQMLDQELSRQIAHAGGLGIGELLYRQFAGSAPQTASPSGQPAQEGGNESR